MDSNNPSNSNNQNNATPPTGVAPRPDSPPQIPRPQSAPQQPQFVPQQRPLNQQSPQYHAPPQTPPQQQTYKYGASYGYQPQQNQYYQPNQYPQNPYQQYQPNPYQPQMQYNYPYYYPPDPKYIERSSMKKAVGYASLFSALSPVVLNIIAIIAVIFVNIIVAPKSSDSTLGLGGYGYQIFNAAIYLVSFVACLIFIPMIFKRKTNPFARFPSASLPQDDKKGPGFAVMLVSLLIGLALCVVANIITNIIYGFLLEIGLPSPDYIDTTPNTFYGLLLSIVFTAIFPAILEEAVWRGHILRALRPHGDFYAVLVSSVLFGMMHGNIVQIPFAFFIGLICGWLAIKTNSIWPSVAIHFLNNFMATMLNYYVKKIPYNEIQGNVTLSFYAAIFIIGIIALVVLIFMKTPMTSFRKQYKGLLTSSNKAGATLSSGGFWVGVVITVALVILSIIASIDLDFDGFEKTQEVALNVRRFIGY